MAGKLNYSINGKNISFSTKSVSINGNEFAYKDITAIKHSSAKCVYLFKVNDKWHDVQYDEAHKKTVSILFHRIADLSTRRTNKAVASQTANASSNQLTESDKPLVGQNEETADTEKKQVEAIGVKKPAVAEPLLADALQNTVHLSPTQAAAIENALSDVITSEDVNSADALSDSVATAVISNDTEASANTASEAASESEGTENAPEAASKDIAETVEADIDDNNAETSAERSDDDATADTITDDADKEESDDEKVAIEKNHRLKKAFLVLAIIFVCFAIIGVIQYFALGFSDDSGNTLQQDSTHQYNDIEELIDEMQ